jgi:hypothetical protein
MVAAGSTGVNVVWMGVMPKSDRLPNLLYA